MEKVWKVFRSRYFLSILVIILEFAQLIVVFTLLSKYFSIISFLGYIFYIGVFLYIINRYESPEFKLPWIIIVMLFFVVGAFVFMLLTSNDTNKKEINKFKENKKKLKGYLINDDSLEKLKKNDPESYLHANYIENATGLPCYSHNKVTYFKLGEFFHEDLLKELKKAEKFIFMEYFILEEGKMWNPIYDILKEKVNDGVEVYVMYDDFGCLSTLDENYYKKLTEEGIKAFPANKIKPVLSKIYNNRDHRKITVIDGKVGYTGGVNIADEYINVKVKHGHWKDTAIKIEGSAVNNLTALFLETWNTQSEIVLEYHKYMDVKNCEYESKGVIAPYGDGPYDFYPDNVGKNVYLNILSSAKKYVYITTPYLICDYELLNALCICAKKGVDVRIITPFIPDKKIVQFMTQSNYESLVQHGVKIYEYTPGFIHAKEFICDDKYAVCGTINLDYRSLAHHFECGTWMYEIDCINDMSKDFLDTLKECQEITLEKAKLKGLKKLLTKFLKVFSPLF